MHIQCSSLMIAVLWTSILQWLGTPLEEGAIIREVAARDVLDQAYGQYGDFQRQTRNLRVLNNPAALQEMKVLKDTENIMFWRPQKVGSSTLLSLLVSYGFRYNHLPRRKAYMNSFCTSIASTATMLMRKNGIFLNEKESKLMDYLSKYSEGKERGSGGPPQQHKKKARSFGMYFCFFNACLKKRKLILLFFF